MLQIQYVAVEMVRRLRAPIGQIETADRDLGRQLRRAASKSAVVILEQLLTSTNARALFDRTHADGYFAGRIDPVL